MRLISLLHRIRSGISRRVHDRRVQTRLQVGSALALAVGLVVSASIFFAPGSTPSLLSDLLYQPRQSSGNVVIVAIDDASLQQIGNLPWSRATLAALINAIAESQPRVVAMDLLLAESSPSDAALAQAIRRAPRVIQPIIGVNTTRAATNLDAPLLFDIALRPAPALQTENTLFAHTLITPDADGVVRRVAISIDASGQRYPALGIAALEAFQGIALAYDSENDHAALGTMRLPIDREGKMRLNFHSREAARVLSAAAVMQGRADLARLRDRVVLIGVTSPRAAEPLATPLTFGKQSVYPIEIQSDLVETILANHLLVEQDRLTQILVIFLIALLAGATLPHIRWLSAIGLTLLYLVMYLSYAVENFNNGILVRPLYPVSALLLTSAVTMLYRYFSEERRRAFLGRLFHPYVAPETIEQVLDVVEDGTLPLGGARREVSVFYVDLREMSGLSEVLTPEAAMALLNQYVALIVATIFQHGGTVSKQTGDSIIAVWNLPLDQSDHARRAVHAALEIRRRIAQLRKEQSKAATIDIGTGVTTGKVIAGHIGASSRAEYIILGEVVGMAERMALKPDRAVFVDLATRKRIRDELETREVNPVRLRRRTDPINVWQVMDPQELEEQLAAEEETLAEEHAIRHQQNGAGV